jgi:hypothetical protein
MIKIYLCPGFVDKCYPDRGTLFLVEDVGRKEVCEVVKN